MTIFQDWRMEMGEEGDLRKVLFGSGGGIPGVTRSLGNQSGDSRLAVYDEKSSRRSRGGGLGKKIVDILKMPLGIPVAAGEAIVGATILNLARKNTTINPDARPSKREKPNQAKKRQEKIERRNRIELWSKQINDVISASAQKRQNENDVILLATKTLGPEAVKKIDNVRKIRDIVPESIEPPQQRELNFAQMILASLNGTDSVETRVEQELNVLTSRNIREVGLVAVDKQESAELHRLAEENEIPITTVTFGEGWLAALLGASGLSKKMVKGGISVSVVDGMVTENVGGDYNQFAQIDKATVDIDIPTIYEATITAAGGRMSGIGKGRFSNWVAKMIGYDESSGRVPVLPGKVTLGNTENDETVEYPALNAPEESRRINGLREVGKKLRGRLEELGDSPDEDQRQLVERLQLQATNEMFELPRKPVVQRIISEIIVTANLPVNQSKSGLNIQEFVSQKKTEILSEEDEIANMEADLIFLGLDNVDRIWNIILTNKLDQLIAQWEKEYGETKSKQLKKSVLMKIDQLHNQALTMVKKIGGGIRTTDMSEGQAKWLLTSGENGSLGWQKKVIEQYGQEVGTQIIKSAKYFARLRLRKN